MPLRPTSTSDAKDEERCKKAPFFRLPRAACDASGAKALRPQLLDVKLMEGAYQRVWSNMAYCSELAAGMALAVNNAYRPGRINRVDARERSG
ncbi:unnamed protein product [Heligmosomoides polygyrus]|uniref:SCP domain-containing protein n=1 Tax=Heligmosomoides polygyrus TaxID=6339 RepID=A0A183GG76_HELPZ|nr:unnamed protein product [Heligmosomoides polygyrus]